MTTEREGLLDKIRALLAKTMENGCTEQETLTALAKARAMMDAYDVSDDELALTKEEKAILRSEPSGAKDPYRIKYFLAKPVADFCGCEVWRNCEHALVFCGLRPDAQLATWLLDALTAFVQGEIANHLMGSIAEGKRERRQIINSFVIGCTDRIGERLEELCEQSTSLATSNAKALVVAKGAAVKAKMEELEICLRSSRSSCSVGNDSSYQAGRAAGDRATFGRPVSGRNATLRLGTK